MKELTSDQKEYIKIVLKKKRRSYNILASLLLMVAIITVAYYLNNNAMSGLVFTPELATIVTTVGSLFILGAYFLIQAGSLSAPKNIEELNGSYILRRRKRAITHKIGGVSVLLPSAWVDYFNPNESYALEGVFIRGTFGKEDFIVLVVQGMPTEEASYELLDMLEAEQSLISKVLFYHLLLIVIGAAPFVGIYYVFSTPELLQNVGDILLSTSKPELILYGIIILLIPVGLILMVRKIYHSISDSSVQVNLAFSWKDWLNVYRDFMEKEMMPLMNNDKHNPDMIMKFKEVMDKNRGFELEYKSYKKSLYGQEKDEFISAFKRIHKSVRKSR